jgi:hypothetical protein
MTALQTLYTLRIALSLSYGKKLGYTETMGLGRQSQRTDGTYHRSLKQTPCRCSLYSTAGSIQPTTTGINRFAECLKHSAKRSIHSAKALPSVTLGKEGSVNSASANDTCRST